MTTQPPKSETIDKLTQAAYPTIAMLSGIQLDVFTPLSEGAKTVEQLADALNVQPAKLKPLMYALVSAGLLKVDNERFSNTSEAYYYLAQGGLGFRASRLALYPELIFKTAETIRTGVPQGKVDYAGASSEVMERLITGRHPDSLAASRDLVNRYDFSVHRRLIDVAAGSGAVTIAVLEEHPQLQATALDLPSVTPFTQGFVEEAGIADRVSVLAGDAVAGPLPGTYDVAVLRAFIHLLSPEQAQQVLINVGQVVEPGGKIYIIGAVLDNSRLTPAEMAGVSLIHMNGSDQGQAYTQREHEDWLSEAGFSEFERVVISGGFSIMTARKAE